MSNIFEIQEDILRAFQAIEDNDGDVTSEIEEQLAISQSNLKSKIKSYVSAVKNLEADLSLIKEEKDRLTALEKAKKGTIDWLKQTMIKAITQFGDVAKNGSKFIDYGTGKVSVSTRQVINSNEDEVEDISKSLIRAIGWFNVCNQLDVINSQDVLDFINENKEESDKYNLEDLANINSEIKVNVDLEKLIASPEGYKLMVALIKYNNFDIKSKADKTNIKNLYKSNAAIPKFAEVVDSKSISIK